jgi:hypothetical protein
MAKVDKPSQTEINRAKWEALQAHEQKTETNHRKGGLCLLVAIGPDRVCVHVFDVGYALNSGETTDIPRGPSRA